MSGTRLGLMLEYQKSPQPGTAHRAASVFGFRGDGHHNTGKARGWVRAGVNMRTRILNPGACPPSRLAQRVIWSSALGRQRTVTSVKRPFQSM